MHYRGGVFTIANPQVETGHLRIANDLFEAICRADLSGAELRVTLAIIRETYGWRRKQATITAKRLMELTGITDRGYVSRISTRLAGIGIIKKQSDWGHPSTFTIIKDYETWDLSPSVSTDGASVLTVDQVSTDAQDNTVLTERQPSSFKYKHVQTSTARDPMTLRQLYEQIKPLTFNSKVEHELQEWSAFYGEHQVREALYDAWENEPEKLMAYVKSVLKSRKAERDAGQEPDDGLEPYERAMRAEIGLK